MKRIYLALILTAGALGVGYYFYFSYGDLTTAARHCAIVGHRGFASDYPENTMVAFEHALPHIDVLEIDLQLTKDNKLVVIHDDTLDRTTNGTGFVRDHTVKQLQELDAGKNHGDNFSGAKIPTLEQVLKWARGKVRLAIELKAQEGSNNDLLKELTSHFYDGFEKEILVSSFDHAALKKLKVTYPRILTILNFLTDLPEGDMVEYVRSHNANGAGFLALLLTRDISTKLRNAGLYVGVYPVNKVSYFHYFLNMGVNFVVSDNPKLVSDERKRLLLDR